jgi:hypothetical protein
VRRTTVGALVVLTGVLVLVSAPAWHTTVDDAWITVRYAEHLAAGHGPVYNTGEWVEGASNPLWTVLLAVAIRCGLDLPTALEVFGLAHAVLLVPAVWWLARTLAGRDHPALLVAPLLVALSPHVGVVATNGLETAQWLLVLVLVCGVWIRADSPRRRFVAGLCCGGLALVRPEGIVLAPLLALFDLVRHRRDLARAEGWALAAGALVVLVPLIALRWSLYGALIPNSIVAKEHLTFAKLWEKNSSYMSYDGPLWPIAIAGVVVAPLVRPRTGARAVIALVALATLAIAWQVEMWMPGSRLLLGLWVLGAAGWGAAAAAGPERWRWGLVGVAAVSLASWWGSGQPWSTVYRYDDHHSVIPHNPASRAAEHVARWVPSGTTIAVRDAGVVAAALGPRLRVVETHPRALTRPHPLGADSRVRDLRDTPPEVVVVTVRTPEMIRPMYSQDREVLGMARYVWLGRARQHHRRYYDFWVRADLSVPPLPAELTTPVPSPLTDK